MWCRTGANSISDWGKGCWTVKRYRAGFSIANSRHLAVVRWIRSTGWSLLWMSGKHCSAILLQPSRRIDRRMFSSPAKWLYREGGLIAKALASWLMLKSSTPWVSSKMIATSKMSCGVRVFPLGLGIANAGWVVNWYKTPRNLPKKIPQNQLFKQSSFVIRSLLNRHPLKLMILASKYFALC